MSTELGWSLKLLPWFEREWLTMLSEFLQKAFSQNFASDGEQGNAIIVAVVSFPAFHVIKYISQHCFQSVTQPRVWCELNLAFHIHGTRSCQWNIVRKYRKLSLPLEFIGVKALYKVSDFTVGSLYTWKELIYVLQLHKVIKVQLRQVFIILIYKRPMTFSEQITYSGIHDHSYNQMPSRIDCIF